jgi:hypothetical protein
MSRKDTFHDIVHRTLEIEMAGQINRYCGYLSLSIKLPSMGLIDFLLAFPQIPCQRDNPACGFLVDFDILCCQSIALIHHMSNQIALRI